MSSTHQSSYQVCCSILIEDASGEKVVTLKKEVYIVEVVEKDYRLNRLTERHFY